MKSLTARQREILGYLLEYQGENGYPPSLRETAARFGINLGTVQDHVRALVRKGYLDRQAHRSRGLRLFPGSGPIRAVPLYGAIPAGDPRWMEETVEGYVALPEEWVKGDEVFLLRVRGESMSPYILPGDQVIVRRQEHLSRGEIGVFRIGQEITLKRFYPEENQVMLKGENPDFPALRFQGQELTGVAVLGKVIGVYRSVEKGWGTTG